MKGLGGVQNACVSSLDPGCVCRALCGQHLTEEDGAASFTVERVPWPMPTGGPLPGDPGKLLLAPLLTSLWQMLT